MDGNIINAFLTMSVIVAALGVLLYILKKTAKKQSGSDEFIDMKVLSKMSLNQKNQVYVVQISGKRLILGVSDSGIRNLSELSYANNLDIADKKLQHNDFKQHIDNESLSFKTFLKSTFMQRAN